MKTIPLNTTPEAHLALWREDLKKAGFDGEALEHKLGEQLKSAILLEKDEAETKLAGAVRATRSYLDRAARVGKLLLIAKCRCKHGAWETYMEAVLQIPDRTVQRYCQVYRDSLLTPANPAIALEQAYLSIDFNPTEPAEKNVTQKTATVGSFQLKRTLEPFWRMFKTRPVTTWDAEEKTEFANDTVERVKLCREAGIELPDAA